MLRIPQELARRQIAQTLKKTSSNVVAKMATTVLQLKKGLGNNLNTFIYSDFSSSFFQIAISVPVIFHRTSSI